MSYGGSKDQYHGHISWAQHGDDMMIASLFQLMGIKQGTYLDLGAHHPTEISNTALLYSRGWHGVNIEANPNLIEAFKIARPRDLTINIGVAPQRGMMTFLMYDDTHGRNSFCQSEVDLDPSFQIRKKMDIHVITLNDVINQHCKGVWPNFVNMDLEGLDYDVLASATWHEQKANLPQVFCIEIRKHDSKRFRGLMDYLGYFIICRMGENLIFVRDDLENLVR